MAPLVDALRPDLIQLEQLACVIILLDGWSMHEAREEPGGLGKLDVRTVVVVAII